MDIVLNRKGGVPVRDQLVAQLELKILGGDLPLGHRLPSVRSLARRLKVHHNTVSAAYQALEDSGHVELRRGAGVFVRRSGATALGEAQGLDEMIRIALTYPEGLRVGNFTDGGTPFADEAYRVENGAIMADQADPRRRMYEQNIIVHPGIIASVAAVDEENGTVLLWMNFGHTGDSYGVGNALVTFEAFKIWGGKIRSINAFFKGLPISTARFWPSSDPVRR